MQHIYSSTTVPWSENLTPITITPFTQPTGPTRVLPQTIKQIFMLFFTSSILDIIVTETNRYAAECLGDLYQAWTPLTIVEFQAYTGFMILMGLVKMPSMYDYWQRDEIFHYAPIANKISRDRFFELHRYLHFVNNATLSAPGTPNYKKIGKNTAHNRCYQEKFFTDV